MRAPVVARNYAETLLALANKHGGPPTVEEFGRAAETVAELLGGEPRVRAFLRAPGIDPETKKRALRASLEGRVPPLFLRFLLVVVEKRRQGLLREIAAAYRDLVDEMLGRVRAEVTLAQPAGPALQREIQEWLEHRLGKTVIPQFRVEPNLLGGVVIRVEDEVLDGSLRRRTAELRRRMLAAELPDDEGSPDS